MEIINDDSLGYKQILENETISNVTKKIKYEDIDELMCSPAVKRGIWRSVSVINEIIKVMKGNPDNIYIEFARDERKKERKKSRKSQLEKIYRDIDAQSYEDYKEVCMHLKDKDYTDKLSSDRLYLYFTQMGRCMYTGEQLDIDCLEMYDIDHIIPRTLLKDDSLDNRVLVLSRENRRKTDNEVIGKNVRDLQYNEWKRLYDNKLISSKKFFNLTRAEYTEKDHIKFLNRQLVETRQITKHVAQLLHQQIEGCNVVTVRAEQTTNFREKYEVFKSRGINDYHHAHDAYIACVVGSYIRKRFPKLDAKYIYGEFIKGKQYQDGKSGFILNSMNNVAINDETGEVLWDPIYISKIKKNFSDKHIYVTKKKEEFDGEFYNATVYPKYIEGNKGMKKPTVPLNKEHADVSIYGGYSGINGYVVAIEGVNKKGKSIRKLTSIPLFLKFRSIQSKEEYIKENENLEFVKIIKDNIKKNQLFIYKGMPVYLTSATEIVNARQLILDEKNTKTLCIVEKSLLKGEVLIQGEEDKDFEACVERLYLELCKKLRDLYPLYKGICKKFEDNIEGFKMMKRIDQCKIIEQMLVIMHANASNGKIQLKDFNVGGRLGRLSKQNLRLDDIVFIDHSITGIYCHKYKL